MASGDASASHDDRLRMLKSFLIPPRVDEEQDRLDQERDDRVHDQQYEHRGHEEVRVGGEQRLQERAAEAGEGEDDLRDGDRPDDRRDLAREVRMKRGRLEENR